MKNQGPAQLSKGEARARGDRRERRPRPAGERTRGGGERSWSGRGTARSDDGDGDGGEYGRRRVLRGAEGAGGYHGDHVLLEGTSGSPTSPFTTRHKSKNVFIFIVVVVEGVEQGEQENLLRAQRELNR